MSGEATCTQGGGDGLITQLLNKTELPIEHG